MKDKIAFYKEILLVDPLSKIFYSLALVLQDAGKKDEAIECLEKGLLYHPDFLEARILCVDLLATTDQSSKTKVELDKVVKTLLKYPNFWNAWAQKETAQNANVALSINFIAESMQQENLTWTEVLSAGMKAINTKNDFFTTTTPSSTIPSLRIPPSDPEYEEIYEENVLAEATVHTRSMADLLAEQGEIEQALEIYKELEKSEENVETKLELQFLITEFEKRLTEEMPTMPASNQEKPENTMKEKLIGTLANLVERLDARAASI